MKYRVMKNGLGKFFPEHKWGWWDSWSKIPKCYTETGFKLYPHDTLKDALKTIENEKKRIADRELALNKVQVWP